MPEKLDPYQAWLGIPPAEQPPNHYRLLGIPLFDGDHRTINAAAERQLALVAAAQTSGNAAIARHIVESRHGKIHIESLPQGGTMVVFDLPDGV